MIEFMKKKKNIFRVTTRFFLYAAGMIVILNLTGCGVKKEEKITEEKAIQEELNWQEETEISEKYDSKGKISSKETPELEPLTQEVETYIRTVLSAVGNETLLVRLVMMKRELQWSFMNTSMIRMETRYVRLNMKVIG